MQDEDDALSEAIMAVVAELDISDALPDTAVVDSE